MKCYYFPMTHKIKFFLYVRKSTDEENRQVLSLDAQTRELREFAKKEGIFICEIIEESKTAKRPGRPLFDRMLARIEEGEANGLLCWDIDRLYRNPIDEGRVRWLLQKSIIVSIRTPTRQFFPDDAGLLMGVEGGRATDFIIRLTKNIQRGIREKLLRGEWPGFKPFGYVYDSRLRNIVPDRQKAKILQTAFEEYAAGLHSLAFISRRLFELGIKSRSGRPWSKYAVHHVLTNRLYIGVMEWKGVTYEGKYKAKEDLVLEKTALKHEKERLQRSRSSYWIEPTLEVVSALESMGKTDFSDSLPEVAKQVKKIGTNHQISGKKVSFSFSEPYHFISDLLAPASFAPSQFAQFRTDEKTQSSKLCSREDSNLHGSPHTVLSRTRLPVPPREL